VFGGHNKETRKLMVL